MIERMSDEIEGSLFQDATCRLFDGCARGGHERDYWVKGLGAIQEEAIVRLGQLRITDDDVIRRGHQFRDRLAVRGTEIKVHIEPPILKGTNEPLGD